MKTLSKNLKLVDINELKLFVKAVAMTAIDNRGMGKGEITKITDLMIDEWAGSNKSLDNYVRDLQNEIQSN